MRITGILLIVLAGCGDPATEATKATLAERACDQATEEIKALRADNQQPT